MALKPTHLSAETVMLVQKHLGVIDAQLERLHWTILPFLPNSSHKGANANETLRNIAQERHNIQKALTELGEAFEGQFSIKRHAEVSRMSVKAYRKKLKEHLDKNGGNSRPTFFLPAKRKK